MRLVVQIPCYNEEQTLPLVLAGIPREIAGIDQVEVLVIDDGSSDGTVQTARRLGVEHIICQGSNLGLARTFRNGLDASLRLGADIIVNTDGDNQYPQADIPRLVAPILQGRADITIGDRQTWTIEHFSPLKKLLQALGSRVVRTVSGTPVADTVSGFRAYNREAALRLIGLSTYSYTVENIIQAGKLGLRTVNVPIHANPETRPSRLKKGNWDFVKKQGSIIVRLYALYEPLRTFFYLSLPFVVLGLFLIGRFLYLNFFAAPPGVARHVQSLVIGGTSLTVGILVFIFGLLADLIATNRRLLEETMYRLRKLELYHYQGLGEQEAASTESEQRACDLDD